jgi:hypothetical protein
MSFRGMVLRHRDNFHLVTARRKPSYFFKSAVRDKREMKFSGNVVASRGFWNLVTSHVACSLPLSDPFVLYRAEVIVSLIHPIEHCA